MYYISLESFAIGFLAGVVATALFVGFAALLVVHQASETDKRGLSARHSRREQWGIELSADPSAALPVLDPLTTPVEQLLAQADILAPAYRSGPPWPAVLPTDSTAPGLSTVAGRKRAQRPTGPNNTI